MFSDEAKARTYFEGVHWPNGPFCPHCGETEKVYRLNGKSHRPGLVHCNSCHEAFTVTVGTVMERSHIPLTKWALGFRLMAASKKGVSAHQLHRTLGITYKAAWFMAHRIREAMDPGTSGGPIGGPDKIVEADETFLSNSPKTKKHPGSGGYAHKRAVLGLVERGGRVRSVKLEGPPNRYEIRKAIKAHVDPATTLHTDGAQFYRFLPEVAKHETVDHSKGEYARGNVHTNTAEGYFSVFKRGMIGVYQHCGDQHLHRYLAEFDFRQSNRIALGVNDDVRTARAVKGAVGKRLTYHQVSGPEAS
ncbi:MAG: IS1595 family transposase [Candidatus Sulfotelmatobacter sp.]